MSGFRHKKGGTEERAEDREQLCRIIRALAGLSSDYRRAATAYYIDGNSVREIAERFSLSESMVKYLLFQSRKRIREGIGMDMESGRLSYDPVDLTLFFWGGKCVYYDIFKENRLRQNIVMACYYEKQTEEQLSLQLGVPTAYLEDELKKLLEYDLITKKGPGYRSNIVIVTAKELEAIDRYSGNDLVKTADGIKAFVDGYMDEFRRMACWGGGMPLNSLKWTLVSLILRRAYVDLMQSEAKPDYPADCFGDRCVRFLMETAKNDPYFVGVSAHCSKDGTVCLWDVPLNGEPLHPLISPVRAEMLLSLPDAQPASDGERLVCAELLEMGLARKEGQRILPAFPFLNGEQSALVNDMILPAARNICDGALKRIDGVSRIMREHAPEHLADYAGKLPPLLQLKEAEGVTRALCESGWLLPMKNCLATTVMMRNK